MGEVRRVFVTWDKICNRRKVCNTGKCTIGEDVSHGMGCNKEESVHMGEGS